jgi:hypothetical protein
MTSSVTVAEAPEGLRAATEVVSRFIDAMARRTAKVVGFSWVAIPTAPSIYPELKAAYEVSKVTGSPLPVSSLYCDTIIYPCRADNYKLRFWHDTLHVWTGLSFDVADELELGLHHTRIAEREGVRKGSLPWRLLRIDLLGQNYLMAVAKRFPADQRKFSERCIQYGLDEAIEMELHQA